MKTPLDVIDKFKRASTGLVYGSVSLTLIIKQGKSRYVIAREESCIPAEGEQSALPVSYRITTESKGLKNKDVA